MMVVPFPIRNRTRHTELVRKSAMMMTPDKAETYLCNVVDEYRSYLCEIGIAPHLVERELCDLKAALNPSPTPSGGMRMAA
jgi:hypothetical protein